MGLLLCLYWEVHAHAPDKKEYFPKHLSKSSSIYIYLYQMYECIYFYSQIPHTKKSMTNAFKLMLSQRDQKMFVVLLAPLYYA